MSVEQQKQKHTGQGEPFTEQELSQALGRAVDRVIRPQLKGRYARHIEDVSQEVALAVLEARHRFDPDKGTLQGWVNKVAANKCADVYRSFSREMIFTDDTGSEGRSGAEKLEAAANQQQINHRQVADHAVVIAEQMAIKVWLDPILAVCEQVMEPRAYLHGFLTHYRWDSDVAEAARHMPTSQSQIREYNRQFVSAVQVVDQAMHAARAGSHPTYQVLRDCLPEESSSGGWAQEVADAVQSWEGPANTMTVDYLAEQTGWSYDTARQRLPKVMTLLRIAASVITHYQALTGTEDH